MADLQFLATEAQKIHAWFQTIFYLLVTTLLVLGIFLEYFRWPLGGMPSFGPLIGRVLIAAILLHTYPEVSNILCDLSQGLAKKLGDLNEFKLVLDRLAEKVDKLTWSWTSVRESTVVAVSYLSFFLLYLSVHVADALYVYAIVILYVFSPILIALYCLPATSGATTALYRSLIEASLWKPVWCVIATLLWSTGVSAIQADTSHYSLLTAICFCIVAAGSLVLTPMVVHALAGGGISTMTRSVTSLGVDGVTSMTPAKAASVASRVSKRGYNTGLAVAERLTEKRLPSLNERIKAAPRFVVRPALPLTVRKRPQSSSKKEKEE
jgi:hypothetical protein